MPSGSKRVLFLIRNIGDYHASRLLRLQREALKAGHKFLAVEAADRSSLYAHRQTRAGLLKQAIQSVSLHGAGRLDILRKLAPEISLYKPDVIFTIGYSDAIALCGLAMGKALGSRVFFLADSKADDQPRRTLSEAVKARILRCFDGALVAGERHRAYFASLGVKPESIQTGYDVVDNEYFAQRAARFRGKASRVRSLRIVPARYVLLVSRLIPRKRVDRALEIYAASRLPASQVKLLIIGQGPEQNRLQEQAQASGIAEHIICRREVKSCMMPLFYAFADALLLTSEYDQWGLSVNEAMACGVPALVTGRCGCAGEIVLHDRNGFVWDGVSTPEGAALLDRLVLEPETRERFSAAAAQTMTEWGLARFADAAMSMVDGANAQHQGPAPPGGGPQAHG
ncbi:MAG: glycosyltransferase family 4 protein [Acidobacteriota bacterium]|nr:glycosyltransferase family 4 protein [Acidobacteriota bacterium]